MGKDIILYNARSQSVHRTQFVLGIGIPLFGSKSVPHHRSLIAPHQQGEEQDRKDEQAFHRGSL
jgi:hypothetical protein